MSVTDSAQWRALPDLPELLAGLQRGDYTLHGGVIRRAAGTEGAGQIVAHLRFPDDAEEAGSSLQALQSLIQEGLGSMEGAAETLQQNLDVLQGLQAANLAMSGLNLAASTAGFVIVCEKLDRISTQIQAQASGIAQTLQKVGEMHERNLLRDEAAFRALLLSARQFIEQGEVSQLKSLIPAFIAEYEFTKLVLEKHAPIAASHVDRVDEIALLQERFVNIGLMLSHVQTRSGSATYGQQRLAELSADIASLNRQRVEALSSDRDLASRLTREKFEALTAFLTKGKNTVQALDYEAGLLGLEMENPGLLQRTPASAAIQVLPA